MAAVVNDRPILVEDVKDRMRAWDPDSTTPAIESDFGKQALDELIRESLMLQEAERLGIEISKGELDRVIEKIKAGYPEQSFQDMLIREFIDFQGWKDRIKNNLLIEKATKTVLDERVRYSVEEWNTFFYKHRQVKAEPGQVLVRHITTRPCDRVRQLVEEIRAGKDFDEVASKLYGDEPRRETSRPVWVFPDLLPETMGQAILNTAVGQMSEVVETDLGCSAFLVMDAQAPPAPDPVTEMANLRRLFMEERRQKEFEAWQTEIRSRAQVSINPALSSHWETGVTH